MKWRSANSKAKRSVKGCHGFDGVASVGCRGGGSESGAKDIPFLSTWIAIREELLSGHVVYHVYPLPFKPDAAAPLVSGLKPVWRPKPKAIEEEMIIGGLTDEHASAVRPKFHKVFQGKLLISIIL